MAMNSNFLIIAFDIIILKSTYRVNKKKGIVG